MLPRLWVCTPHPWLEVLSFPLGATAILLFLTLAFTAQLLERPVLAQRLHRLWIAWSVTLVSAILLFSIVGSIVEGPERNSVFVAARYAWVPLAAAATLWGALWGRKVRAAAKRRQEVKYFLLSVASLLALLAVVARNSRYSPSRVIFALAEWIIDSNTPTLVSNECAAFRVADYRGGYGLLEGAGREAKEVLQSRGVNALPGIIAYLEGSPQLDAIVFQLLLTYDDDPAVRAWLARACAGKSELRLTSWSTPADDAQHPQVALEVTWPCRSPSAKQ